MIKESVWTIGDVNPKCPNKYSKLHSIGNLSQRQGVLELLGPKVLKLIKNLRLKLQDINL